MDKTLSILSFDARTLMRDNFLTVVASLTGFFLVVFGIAGIYRDALGIADWQPWVPYILIMFLVSNVSTYGMLFGLVLVEEVETRARAALMVLPIHPVHLLLLRTLSLVIWLLIQPFLFAACIAVAWDAVPFGYASWFLLCAALTPLGAALMIILSTVASNRVEALAMGKFFSIATTPPLLLYLLPADAWYRHLFLLFPTTPIIHAFDAFRERETGVASVFLLLALAYALILMMLAIRHFIRRSYKVTA